MSPLPPILHIHGLKRHYAMGGAVVCALDGIDVRVEAGEFVTVMGSSGSGKSTLMHLIGLLDLPTDGAFEINGRDVSRSPDTEQSRLRNRHIGFVFQQFNLLADLDVVDNIALPLVYSGVPLAERRARATELACRLGLADRLQHDPTELSGGQLQRVAIARALVNDPDILLADEPTGNLDSATSREIMQILYDLHAQGRTIIMVTHDPSLADQGTRRLRLCDGRIVEDVAGRRARPSAVAAIAPVPAALTPADRGLGLHFGDLVRIGIREGLMAHQMRTFLTMLGIIIGVSSVIAMSSFSLGSKKKQANQIRELGANLVRVVDRRLENERLTAARMQGSIGLGRQDLDAITRAVGGIRRAAYLREIKLAVLCQGEEFTPRVLGVGGDYLAVNNLTLAAGRPFDPVDVQHSARVAVLGSKLAAQVARRLDSQASATGWFHRTDPRHALGAVLLLGGTPYEVVGVLAAKPIDLAELDATSISDPNHDLLIPLETLLARTVHLDLRSEVDELQLQLQTEDDLYSVGRELKSVVAGLHAGVQDFDLVIPMDLLKQKQQSQRLLDVLTICISSISILVGGIGIMNIMLASVTERIREIGIRRATGATRRDIMAQFLSESMVIAVTGGLFGVLLAVGLVIVTCWGLRLPVVFSLPLLVIAVLASTVTGLVFGLYPAYQAANKNPVEALRYE